MLHCTFHGGKFHNEKINIEENNFKFSQAPPEIWLCYEPKRKEVLWFYADPENLKADVVRYNRSESYRKGQWLVDYHVGLVGLN